MLGQKNPVYYLNMLNGRKHFIVGNHDKSTLKSEKSCEHFKTVEKIYEINDGGNRVILCHFPISNWNGRHRGAYHIYGHIHGNQNELKFIIRLK